MPRIGFIVSILSCSSDICVIGYPRSGCVWLARLLGDALDWPVVGFRGGADSLAAEGYDRPGPKRVVQSHFRPAFDCEFVHIVRDPRDVAVSAMAYWGWTLEHAMQVMIEGPGPLDLPPWRKYVETWMQPALVRYEDLSHGAVGELRWLVGEMARKTLVSVVQRQSFSVRRAEIERRGDEYPFGKQAQLKHMRRGQVGEWRRVFTPDMMRWALDAWGPILQDLNYERD